MRVESHSEPMYQGQVLYVKKIRETADSHRIRKGRLGGAADLGLSLPLILQNRQWRPREAKSVAQSHTELHSRSLGCRPVRFTRLLAGFLFQEAEGRA